MLRIDRVLTIAALLFFTSIFNCGCGKPVPPAPPGPKAVVKATVTHDGKKITVGSLYLVYGTYTVTANAGPDGTYLLKGIHGDKIPVGKYKVGITPPVPEQPPIGSGKMAAAPVIEGVPAKFYNAETSGVSVEIKEGTQDLSIELK